MQYSPLDGQNSVKTARARGRCDNDTSFCIQGNVETKIRGLARPAVTAVQRLTHIQPRSCRAPFGQTPEDVYICQTKNWN